MACSRHMVDRYMKHTEAVMSVVPLFLDLHGRSFRRNGRWMIPQPKNGRRASKLVTASWLK